MRLHPLQVAAVERLTDDSVTIEFDVPPPLRATFSHEHGQHLVIEHDGRRRTYSICAPAGSGTLRVAVKRLPGGAFSSWANERLRAGETLAVMPPSGRFTTPLDPANRKRYAAIAAGSGVTPILSIAGTILEREPHSEVVLAYGNRTSGSIMFLEELSDLKDRHLERLQLLHVLSREPRSVELLSGRLDRPRLTRLLDSELAVDDVDEWFLCGPFELVETARELLRERGVPAERVHREIFHVTGEPARAPAAREESVPQGAATVTVRLDGRTSSVSVPYAGVSVLDALLAVRGDAPYACKGGVCGTCRAHVVEGAVHMEHTYALEQHEIDAGFVLACQARPASERVVLDFDV